MTALDSPDVLDPEGQDPQNPSGPGGNRLAAGGTLMLDQGPPPVLPTPKDEHDLEVSLNLIKQSLHSRAQQLNLQHLQQMAAAGQMQAYDAGMMQQATGGQLEEEMALMSFGMPQTNVRVPENRKAYEDWFGDMERRASAAGMPPERMAGVKQRYSEFQGLAQRFDQDKQDIGLRISSLRNYYEGGARKAIEVGTALPKGISGGYVGTNSRQEDLVTDVKKRIDELMAQRFPSAAMGPLGVGPGEEAPPGGPKNEEQESYRKLLTDEAWDQLRKTLDRPGMTPKGITAFTEKALETLGMLAPMGAAAKGGVAVATKAGLGKLAPHIGNMIGFGAYGAAAKLNPEQEHRINTLPEGDRLTGQIAARIENGVAFGVLAPVWTVAGGAGAALGKGLSKAIGGSGEGLLSGLLQGAGTGLTLPLAGEVENLIRSVGVEAIPAMRELAEKKLIAKPELQTPLIGMVNSAKAGDGQSFLANLTRYVEEALPGMVAFGSFHGVVGMRRAFKAEQLDLLEGKLRETKAQAEKEADKLAQGDPKLAEQLKQGLDEAQAKVEREVHGEPTREAELAERVGPEEAKRVGDEAEVLESAGIVAPERVAKETLTRREGDVSATPERSEGASEAPERAPRANDLRRQEKLLTRRIGRTEDPAIKAELQAQRDELRTQRREIDAKTLGSKKAAKPKTVEEVKAEVVSEAAEAGDTPSRSVARGKALALRYEEAARSSALSPAERAAAADKAAEWTSYQKEVAAWEKAGSHGEEPAPPSRGRSKERLAMEQGERASRRLTEPMPVREQAAAQHLAYRESEQRKVDVAAASGRPEVGLVVEDMAGHKATVEELVPAPGAAERAILRNSEGEVEVVDLKEGKIPEELAIVGRETGKPKRKAEDAEPAREEAKPPEHEEIVARPESEATVAQGPEEKAQLDTMHKEVESLGSPEASGLLKELSSLKARPGAKTTDMVKGYAEIAAEKVASPEAKEFLKFVAEHADLAANRHGERFTAEMVFQWQAKKHSWPSDPRGETMGELTRWLQDELSQVLKEVRLTGDVDTFKSWAAHQSMLLAGPWAAAARVHPDGKLILKRIAEMEAGQPPTRDAGFLRVPNPIKVWSYLRNFRADAFTALLDQAHANPRAHAKLLHLMTGSKLAAPIGEFGYIAKEKIASEMESRAALNVLIEDFFDVQNGILAKAKADPKVDKMLFEILDDPRGATARAAFAARHTDPMAKAVLDGYRKIRAWNKKALGALVEVHPTAVALRASIRAARRDVITLTDAWSGASTPKAQKALLRELNNAQGFLQRLQQSLERFKNSYGIKDYMHHIPRYEIVGGAKPGMYKAAGGPGISAIEAKRQVYGDIMLKREGGLKKKGLLGDSAWKAVNHYMHSIVPLTYRSRFLSRIEERLYGTMERLTARELLRGRDDVIFGELRGSRNLGLYTETKVPFTTTKGVTGNAPTYGRHKAGTAKTGPTKILLWVGDPKKAPSKSKLADPKWVTRNLQTSKFPSRGLLVIDKSVASKTFRVLRGGLWEHIGDYQQGRIVKYINDARQMKEQMTGVVGDEYHRLSQLGERAARWMASWMSSLAMGGNIHNAANNIVAGTALNMFFGVGAKDAAIMSTWLKRHTAYRSQKIAGRAVSALAPEGAKPSKKFDPETYSLSDTWDAHYRTPKAELDAMTPEKRAEQVLVDDSIVALMQSGVLGTTHANRMLGQSMADKRWGEPEQPGKWLRPWQAMRQRFLAERDPSGKTTYTVGKPGETIRDGKRVQPDLLDKISHFAGNVAEVTRPITDPIGRLWWSGFEVTEAAIRAPIFIKGYREARALGRNHSEALAEGIMSTHLAQMVYTHAAKSDFFNSPVGTLLGNMSSWTAHVGGRMLALPLDKLAVLAGYNVACMMLTAQTMGIHGFNLFGSSLRDLPWGDKLEDFAFQLGVRDPAASEASGRQGLMHRGMIYNLANKAFGMPALPLPTPIPARFGPIVPMMEALAKAGIEAMRGNGEAASKNLWQATGAIDPLRSNAARQVYKAFGVPGFLPQAYQSENVPQSGGGAVYQPPGASRGSSVLEHQGWEQFRLEMMPGADIKMAAQWQMTQLARARNELVASRHRALNEQGRQLMSLLGGKKLSELPKEDQEVFKGMKADLEKTAHELGRPITRSDLEEWHETAAFEAKTDARLRAAVAAPSKAAKVREITALLADPGYNLSKERWTLLAEKVGGKKGLSAWLDEAEIPEADKAKLKAAYKLRKSTWDPVPAPGAAERK